jgi:thiamine thiazole synthase
MLGGIVLLVTIDFWDKPSAMGHRRPSRPRSSSRQMQGRRDATAVGKQHHRTRESRSHSAVDRLEEPEISKTILCTYHEKLLDRIVSDVLIVGAGPAGMMAAIHLAREGLKVTLLEKRLAPGGGIWGGGIGMSQVVIQEDALPLLNDVGVKYEMRRKDLYAADAIELAAGLCSKTLQAGAALFNLMTVEDVCVHGQRVTGAVVNRTTISGQLPVDPIAFSAKAVLDATGHEAAVVDALRKRGLLTDPAAVQGPGEGPMDATSGEAFVVEQAGEVFPGLWIAGMSVCATRSGPRMGPIFGGMLLSGKRVAELIASAILHSGGNQPEKEGSGRREERS